MIVLFILTHALALAAGMAAWRYLVEAPEPRIVRGCLKVHARNRSLRSKCAVLETECADLAELHERLLERVKAHTAIEVQRQEFAQARTQMLEMADEQEQRRVMKGTRRG